MFGAAAARARSEVFGELATLVGAGVSIGHALGDLGEDLGQRHLGSTLVRMGRRVSSGTTLADAMRDEHGAFEPLTVAMIEAGEQAGRLDEALRGVAQYHERDLELRHLLTRELAYPLVLLGAIIVIPTAAQFIIKWLTGSLAAAVVAAALRLAVTLIYLGVPAGIIYAIYRSLSSTETGRRRLDAIKLGIPIIGGVVRRVVMARFCRALASLYSSGVLMGSALRLAAAAAGNAVVADELTRGAAKVDAGGKLSDALEQAPHVPRTVVRMIRTGEDSGEIDRMAHNVAEHYEMEAQTAIKQMAVTITPIAVLIAAVIIGMMYIGSFLQIYSGMQ